jgi:hypothetical protein
MPMASLKPRRKNEPEQREQAEGHRFLAFHPGWNVRVLNDVRGGVGGGEGHRDDEVRCGEPEQDQDKALSAPFGEEFLEHADTALAVGAGLGDTRIDGEGAEQCDQD